ncbi:MAG: ABC-three component system protein [Desulfomicrobium sp.]
MQSRSQYSAAGSLLGYIYQCRLALFESLKRLKSDPDVSIAIETIDDVVFEKDGSPTEIIQVKHHINRKANLTDSSIDLWKTIRIWCDLCLDENSHGESILCLMTTEAAAANSAAYLLRVEERNVLQAEQMLLQVSQTSSNESNRAAYDRFNSLSSEQRLALLERVCILDNCPVSKDLGTEMQTELWGHCERQYVEQFLAYLEGWWMQRLVAGLDNSSPQNITGHEIDAQLNALREQFTADSLPVHPEIRGATPDTSPFSNWLFVKQLRLIDISESRIQRAATHFYKASEQRSRWVRETLLVDYELEQYDDILKEEWEIRFDQAQDAMPENATSSDNIASGKNLYQWVEAEANIPIRPSCQDRFITRGSYQILANRLQVGWHPDYMAQLTSKTQKEDS